MHFRNHLYLPFVLGVLHAHCRILTAFEDYTTNVCSLIWQTAWTMLSINLLLQSKSKDPGRKGSCQTSFFIFSQFPQVSLCILWPQIINIICYPGSNNKIQRHDSTLIKIWRGANIFWSLYEILSQGSRNYAPSPIPVFACRFYSY